MKDNRQKWNISPTQNWARILASGHRGNGNEKGKGRRPGGRKSSCHRDPSEQEKALRIQHRCGLVGDTPTEGVPDVPD